MGSGHEGRNQEIQADGVGGPELASMGSGHEGRNQQDGWYGPVAVTMEASMGSGHEGRNQGSRKNDPVTCEYTGLRERW